MGSENPRRRRTMRSAAEVEVGPGSGEKKRLRLLNYSELPEYLRDNEFILDHYRSEWPIKDAILSAFLWHNETLNVWTHLGGFLLFVVLTVTEFADAVDEFRHLLFPGVSRFIGGGMNDTAIGNNQSGNLFTDSSVMHSFKLSSNSTSIPRWPVLVFMFGSMTCLAFSSISHLLACHSHRLYLFFWRLDYSGISIMIVSSFFPPIYYAFLCNQQSLFTYLSIISVLGILVVLTLLAPAFSSPRFRPFRASLFLAMGFSGIVPAVHAILINWEYPACHLALALEVAMGLAYGIGACIYVNRVPERWKPGAFDIAGHSHQIFHVFVLFGAVTHYIATKVLLDWRVGGAGCTVTGAALGL